MQYTSLIHSFSGISDHLSAIVAAGGYPLLFLAVLLEGLPLFGTFVPGHVAIIGAGFLAKVGIMNIWWVIILSLVAAVIGDFIGFSLGRKYGLSLIDRFKRYFFMNDSHIEKAQKLLEKHTGKAMILGRLSPVTRALMPFIVGTGKTSYAKFWIYNVIGASIWVVLSVFIGYAFGFGYSAAAGYFGRFIVIAIIIGALLAWGYRFANSRFHVFRRYELFVLILNIISFWTLAKMIEDAWSVQSFMAGFDVFVNDFAASHVTHAFVFMANIVSTVGGTAAMIVLGLALTVFLAWKKRWRSSVIMFLSIASASALVSIMKDFFMRARPDNSFIPTAVGDWSFPSGHATLAAAFFIALAYIFAPKIRTWVRREIFIVVCVLAFIVVGLSRIVLNVHWASDVIAGWSLGIFCATASILLVRYIGELFWRSKK